MKLNQLAEKILPPLLVVAIITMAGSYLKLEALIVKVDLMDSKITMYHGVKK